ncbi:hypothetical protein LTR36_004014 [Oleoguttula mirabilis]|uniref:Uncharacterized protein n=1 Tax=Oleoguttula mirabilis TaxID=1507867 RepID=A0AAV9JI99_9PEZI|nr:hypothetical protein LTR36_004014 [Oleoguttula mirabilis]
MYTTGLALTTLLALAARATPIDLTNTTLKTRAAAETFQLRVWNNCHFVKEVALYQITPAFNMVQKSNPTNIQPGKELIIHAPFKATGMRLSGHAEWGTAGQWKAQALFEFGYSTYAGTEGTAYDLSVMQGSDGNIGIGGYPIPNGKGSKYCPSKTCFPWKCDWAQGWTNPDQVNDGSPADTVCYKGKTDFKVVFCP